jgi:hypothetical protein
MMEKVLSGFVSMVILLCVCRASMGTGGLLGGVLPTLQCPGLLWHLCAVCCCEQDVPLSHVLGHVFCSHGRSH